MGGGRGQCSGPTGLEEAWGLCREGLRLNEQKGPWHAPHHWSQRAGDLTWEPSSLPVPEWTVQSLSAPLPPLLEGPYTPLSCSPLSLLPMPPRKHVAWRGLWRAGDWPGDPAGFPCLSGRHNRSLLLSRPSWRAPPVCLSWSPRPPSSAPRTHAAWRGLWRWGVPTWELSRFPDPSGPGESLRPSPALPGESLPPASPDLPGLTGTDPV